MRHGYESTHPNGGLSNREHLEKELGDIQNAISMLTDKNDISKTSIIDHKMSKHLSIKYLHHQD